MAPTSSWLYRLGQQTVDYHATADAQRLALMNVASVSQYRTLLERIYGFEGAVERYASAIDTGSAAVEGARSRKGRLHRDLLALGLNELDIATLPVARVDVRSTADAFGWLFVIERHVLLAGLIRRYLQNELDGAFAIARSYLDTHVDGGRRFRDFSDAVNDTITRCEVRPDAVLGAARAAFNVQRHWYAHPAQRRRQAQTWSSTNPRNAA